MSKIKLEIKLKNSETLLVKQKAFLKLETPFRAFIGGFGCGKTLAGCLATLRYLFKYPKSISLVGRKTYQQLRDTTQYQLLSIIPSELIKKFSKTENKLTLVNDSIILFRCFNEANKFKSLNLNFFSLMKRQILMKTFLGCFRLALEKAVLMENIVVF